MTDSFILNYLYITDHLIALNLRLNLILAFQPESTLLQRWLKGGAADRIAHKIEQLEKVRENL